MSLWHLDLFGHRIINIHADYIAFYLAVIGLYYYIWYRTKKVNKGSWLRRFRKRFGL